jgi:hypothetical protein
LPRCIIFGPPELLKIHGLPCFAKPTYPSISGQNGQPIFAKVVHGLQAISTFAMPDRQAQKSGSKSKPPEKK